MEPLYITGLNRFCIPGQEGTIEPILRRSAVRDGIEKLALIRFGEHLEGMRKFTLSQPDRELFNELYERIQLVYNQVMNKEAADVIAYAKAEAVVIHEKAKNEQAEILRSQPGDVPIRCSNGMVTAHKCILVAFENSFFKSFILNSNFKEQIEIPLNSHSTEVVSLCLDLMYQATTCVEVAFEDLLELYKLIDYLALSDLKTSCESAIKQYAEIAQSNTLEMCTWVQDYSVRLPEAMIGWKLHQKVLEVIVDRYKVEVEAGDPLAMNNLGYAYQCGHGTQKMRNLGLSGIKRVLI